MRPVRAGLDLRDDREFSLAGYGLSHTWALFRGFPPRGGDPSPTFRVRVLDVAFLGLDWIATRKHVQSLHVRMADQAERDALTERVGRIRESNAVFFLEAGSTESFVIASRVYWAEYELIDSAESPLVSDDHEYRLANPPLGPVRYADCM
ncbi:hypothetical protein [Lentzea aerocolonigenes]|uniref:hypothetical protein n=1 Tax=Lentzea aerocolonigenes TaxID=68170 RepID=UPI000696BF84|nr:hypothetical protein [Lentzea aerocolonigenes]